MNKIESPPEQQRTGGDARQPIAVAVVRFAVPMDGGGLGTASSCTSHTDARPSRHTVSYLPWMRSFKIEYRNGPEVRLCYVPEHQVKSWDPVSTE